VRGQLLKVPVAHGEGCYFADPQTLDMLEREDRVVVRYVDNPNGSLRDIAGICNERRNVMGLMPHPEDAVESLLGSTDGRVLFESMVHSLVANPA
jgi:phosphoribosylformylglycinamidine synthase